MKLLLLLVLFSSQLFAADEKLCAYLKQKTFQVYSQKVIPPGSYDRLTALVEKVSVVLDSKREAQCKSGNLYAIKDFDSCSSLCVEEGTSSLRMSAALASGGLIKASEDSRECQRLCKSYQLLAMSYEDGLKESSLNTPDCSGAVVSGDRGNSKSDLKDIVKKVKSSGVTKQ